MTLSEWNQVNAVRTALWGEHRAPMPDAKTLQLSLPAVADVDFQTAVEWLNAQAAAGARFAPGAADIAGAFAAAQRPSTPTFDEMFLMVFGDGRGGGILRREMRQEDLDRVHPLVASWVVRSGPQRLASLEVFCPDYGELRRRDLRVSWEQHVEAFAGREQVAAALPPGDRERGLQRLDPLAALGIERPKELQA